MSDIFNNKTHLALDILGIALRRKFVKLLVKFAKFPSGLTSARERRVEGENPRRSRNLF